MSVNAAPAWEGRGESVARELLGSGGVLVHPERAAGAENRGLGFDNHEGTGREVDTACADDTGPVLQQVGDHHVLQQSRRPFLHLAGEYPAKLLAGNPNAAWIPMTGRVGKTIDARSQSINSFVRLAASETWISTRV